jgi:hypothetical protein
MTGIAEAEAVPRELSGVGKQSEKIVAPKVSWCRVYRGTEHIDGPETALRRHPIAIGRRSGIGADIVEKVAPARIGDQIRQ